jgi:demethylmenaquinone methyltransferase/2-methoxy-6-polyprenyl-1,4-benzoquinol methylase
MFDSVAPRYDLLNRTLSFGQDARWRWALADCVDRAGARRVLDLCCGTGDMAMELARPERGRRPVVGVDFSPPMLALGTEKVARAGLGARVLLCAGDALALPFDDGEFDAVTVTFGLRNLTDLLGGLLEIHRILRPGGSVAVLEFLRPSAGPIDRLGAAYRRHMVPALARVCGGDAGAYSYLARTVDRFYSLGEFHDLLSTAGFAQTMARRFACGIVTLVVAVR